MARKLITEIVNVNIKSTDEEKRQVLAGNSIVPIGKLYKRYQETKESYINNGYEITSEDPDNQSFIAEKQHEVDEE